MLWCKWLPFLAPFWGCQKEVAIAPHAVDPIELCVDILEANPEWRHPPTITALPATVTITVGIPATAVIHTHAPAATYYPTAAPYTSGLLHDYRLGLYAPSDSREHLLWETINIMELTGIWIYNLYISICNRYLALRDDGIEVKITVSLYDLWVTAHVLGWLHLFCMIVLRDYKLPTKAVKYVLSALASSNMVYMTMLFTGLRLPEDPITLAVSEILFWNVEHDDFISRFVAGKVFSWKHFWHYTSAPRNPDYIWMMEELGLMGKNQVPGVFWPAVQEFEHVRYAQRNGNFTPKTFTEIFFGFLVLFYLRIAALCNSYDRAASAVWRVIGPSITRQATAFPGRVQILFQFVHMHMQNYGFDWYSPLRGAKTILLGFWHLPVSVYAFLRVWYWSRIEANCGKPFETNPGQGISMKTRAALEKLGNMSMGDMANLILEHEQLKLAVHMQEPWTRQRVEKEHAAVMTELANRTRSWRASHRELLSDYNHCRATLDNVLRANLCSIMDIDADAAENQDWFSSGFVTMSEDALPNGLHYRQPKGAFHEISDERRGFNSYGFRRIMLNARKGICGAQHRQMYMPRRIDVYNEKTWPIDLRLLGLRFARFQRDANPFDLDQRCPRPYVAKEIEDYVAAGKLQQWFEDMPERLRFKRGTMTDFFNQHPSKLVLRNGYWQRP